jgi:parallel beta-helix repeat protein
VITYTEDLVASNDEELRDLADKYRWPGSGTQKDPYIIENAKFAPTSEGYNIITSKFPLNISKTSAWLVIRNCVFDAYRCIKLDQSKNVSILDCDFIYPDRGIFLYKSTNILVRNCTFRGTPGSSFSDGIYIEESSRIELSYNKFVHIVSLGIKTFAHCSQISIHHNTISGTKYGMHLNMDNSEVYDNDISDSEVGIHLSCRNSMIYKNRCSFGRSGISMSNSHSSTVLSNELSGEAGATGIEIAGSSGNTIGKNTCTGCKTGIYMIDASTENRIMENDVSGSGHIGIDIRESSNNIISNNNCSSIGGPEVREMTAGYVTGCAILLDTAPNNRVLDNVCAYSDGYGIMIHSGSDRNIISGNDCSNIGSRIISRVREKPKCTGIIIIGSDNSLVENNICESCFNYGILVAGSKNTTVRRNKCSYNTGAGILTAKFNHRHCYDAKIIENTCVENGEYGIWLGNVQRAEVNSNICSGNDVGIFLKDTEKITLRGNDVRGNRSGGIVSDNAIDSVLLDNLE